jgi:uncharacterized peroxidase-related enzyme
MTTTTQTLFAVPTRETVSENNQAIFDQLTKGLGMVPNLYATFAHSETALGDYMKLQSRKSSLSLKENEVINLVVSQVNQCQYCLAAHTLLGQKAGFSAEQIVDIRRGEAAFDDKLNALATFVRSVAENRGHVSDVDTATILDAGYNQGNIVDIVVAVGDKTITNYLHAVTEVPIDFPTAPAI